MVKPAQARVAVIGGDGRNPERWRDLGEIRTFCSPRDGGNGEQRRLLSALRAGSFDRVVILTRWNSHSATRQIRKLCRELGVPVQLEA